MSDWVMPLALLKSSPHMILGTKECVCSWYIVSDSSSSASRQRYRWVVIARSYCHKTQLISLLSRTASDFDYDLLQHQMRSRNHHKNPLAHSVWKWLKIVTLEFRAFSIFFLPKFAPFNSWLLPKITKNTIYTCKFASLALLWNKTFWGIFKHCILFDPKIVWQWFLTPNKVQK